MDRRDWLLAAGGLMAVGMTGMAHADDMQHMHDHHHPAGPRKYQALETSTAECRTAGEACLAHCLELLAQGDTTMAACAQNVNQMLAVCDALGRLAAQQSKYTPRLAALTADLCKDCEAECRKHEKEHAECKACADACAACLKECRKITA